MLEKNCTQYTYFTNTRHKKRKRGRERDRFKIAISLAKEKQDLEKTHRSHIGQEIIQGPPTRLLFISAY